MSSRLDHAPGQMYVIVLAAGMMFASEARAQEVAWRDSVIRRWSVEVGGTAGPTGYLEVSADSSYLIWRIDQYGDTLLLSQGTWTVRKLSLVALLSEEEAKSSGAWMDHFCIRPTGKGMTCGQLFMTDRGAYQGTALGLYWPFADTRETGAELWRAFERGLALWELWR